MEDSKAQNFLYQVFVLSFFSTSDLRPTSNTSQVFVSENEFVLKVFIPYNNTISRNLQRLVMITQNSTNYCLFTKIVSFV